MNIEEVGMEREIVDTDKAPAAVGPYSQAVVVGRFVFASGQIAIDPQTGELIRGGIVEQTRQVLRNLAAVLETAGSSMDQVVKATVFLSDMPDFQNMNRVYEEFFPSAPPARSTVEVGSLPLGALIEIEAIAVK
jgi:2-iminobutanoate/2-iminopropanoate deaminase